MKQILIPICLVFTLFCSFTITASNDPENPKKGKRSDEIFMLGFEIYRTDNTALNNTDIKIEIYDHHEQRTINTRDYRELPSNKFSATTYFEDLPYGHDLTLLIQAPNFFAKEITFTYDSLCTLKTIFCINGLTNPPHEINGEYGDRYILPITLDSITVGEELVIPNIYYAYNSAELLTSSFWVLDSLSRVIEHNPDISIELGGHADARGGDEYNMELSQRRVSSVEQYLMEKLGTGVSYRVTATGYGESKLLNHCGNGVVCADNQHQENRRTTFKINQKIKKATHLSLEERIQRREQLEQSREIIGLQTETE